MSTKETIAAFYILAVKFWKIAFDLSSRIQLSTRSHQDIYGTNMFFFGKQIKQNGACHANVTHTQDSLFFP